MNVYSLTSKYRDRDCFHDSKPDLLNRKGITLLGLPSKRHISKRKIVMPLFCSFRNSNFFRYSLIVLFFIIQRDL